MSTTSSADRIMVVSSDPTQPSRLEKKKNTVAYSNRGRSMWHWSQVHVGMSECVAPPDPCVWARRVCGSFGSRAEAIIGR
jgi:hypothetical protein